MIPTKLCCEPKTHMEAHGLSLRYRGKPALEDVSIPLYHGCLTALVGPSGCGKTSFLTSLNRLTDLVAGCTVSGKVTLSGADIHAPSLDVRGLRRRVGMIFQKPNPFPLSIRKNFLFPLREHGIRNAGEAENIVESVLRRVGLWDEVSDRLDSPAFALSGGQQQRLCIARALALTPEVLLLDEPCSALDPLSSGVVEDLIRDLKGTYTVVIVTHNLAQARRIADYAAFFWVRERSGRLIEYAAAGDFFSSPKDELTAAYIQGVRG